MRAYLAVVKDAFREAIASRVLWIALGLITFVLLVLAPLTWQRTSDPKLTQSDIRHTRNLARALALGEADGATELQAYLWQQLPQESQERMKRLSDESGRRARRENDEVAAELNELLQQPEFYQPELWVNQKLPDAAVELTEQASLSDDETRLLNRLALEAALPGQLRSADEETMQCTYDLAGIWSWPLDFLPRVSRRTAITAIEFGLNTTLNVFVGFFGIFAGILITAAIIPNMLVPGSLYSLLSKPVYRPLLLLAKFLGGCSFVFISAAYLIVGIWLILGVRFELWRPRILWAIPLFVFSFAIFYCVSTLAGLVWRNAVMAIVATCVFWFVCTLFGVIHGLMGDSIINPELATRVQWQDDQLFANQQNGDIVRWDTESGQMQPVLESSGRSHPGPPFGRRRDASTLGMIYQADQQRLVLLQQAGSVQQLHIASAEQQWQAVSGPAAPEGAAGLAAVDGQILALAKDGVYQLNLAATDEEPGEVNLFGFSIPLPQQKSESHTLVSEPLELPNRLRVSYDAGSGAFLALGKQQGDSRLWRIAARDDGKYAQTHQVELHVPQPLQAEQDQEDDSNDNVEFQHLAVSGNRLGVLQRRGDQRWLQLYTADSLEPQQHFALPDHPRIRALHLNDKFAAVHHEDHSLLLFDLDSGQQVTDVPYQDNITAVQLQPGAMSLANKRGRFVRLSLPALQQEEVIRPHQEWPTQLYHMVVHPIYLLFPKPAELEHTMLYAITGKTSVPHGFDSREVYFNPWNPILSNSAFIGVVLLISCVYFARQDY